MAAVRWVVATVLFTDIVDSTGQQAALGDIGWKHLLERHNQIVRERLVAWGGVENDTAGDGFYVTFLESAANGVRCALDIRDRLREAGIVIRAGLHLGTCEIVDGKCCGLTVSIGARVAAAAEGTQVLASGAVRDRITSVDLQFTDAGEYELKGVPGRWRLFRASSRSRLRRRSRHNRSRTLAAAPAPAPAG